MKKKINQILPNVGEKKNCRMLFLLVILIFCTAFYGCGSRAEDQADPENGSYEIYFVGSGYRVVTEIFQTQTEKPEEIAEELIAKMASPNADTDGISVFPDGLELNQAELTNGVLSLSFNSAYQDQSAVQEILCRSYLADALCDIPGVEALRIYIDDQRLTDSQGKVVGIFSERDFVLVSGGNANTLNRTTFTLYFFNPNTQLLAGVPMEVTYSATYSVEEFLVEKLIEGPETDDYLPVVPSNMRIRAINVRNGVCYLNLTTPSGDGLESVTAEQSIYAIVNSLTSLPSIQQVQITLDGSADTAYFGLSIKEPFHQNLDYVENAETSETPAGDES